MSVDLRKHHRVDSLNLSYVCIDDNGVPIQQSMGRTLNISESGLRLETDVALGPGQLLEITLALEDELVELKGKTVYCRQGEGGMYELGVEFHKLDAKDRPTLKKYIKHFEDRAMEQGLEP